MDINVNLENYSENERVLLMSLIEKGVKENVGKYPADGTIFFYINAFNKVNQIRFYSEESVIKYLYDSGNYYETEEAANLQQEKNFILAEINKWKRVNDNIEVPWNKHTTHYVVIYNPTTKELRVANYTNQICGPNTCYFSDKIKGQDCINYVGEERIKKLFN